MFRLLLLELVLGALELRVPLLLEEIRRTSQRLRTRRLWRRAGRSVSALWRSFCPSAGRGRPA